MCTVFSSGGYFARTLDFEDSFGVGEVLVPRCAAVGFLHFGRVSEHLAFVGAGLLQRDFPLVFDGVNEAGVFAAALNFPKSAVYRKSGGGRYDIASFEVVTLVLSLCNTAREGALLLGKCRITDDAFSEELGATPLHWFIADGRASYTVEQTKEGLIVFKNHVGVLTNEPPFSAQLQYLSGFSGLSPRAHKGGFTERLGIQPISRGGGALGLPGDFSSPSRFVRTAFAVHNTDAEEGEMRCISRMLKIAGIVSVPRGCVVTDEGKDVCTQYTSCASREGYWYSTYDSLTVKCTRFRDLELDASCPEWRKM